MKTNRIDGNLFEQMLRNGLNNIILNESKVNQMNVFPVPDGDTGTNMRLTLNSGIQKAGSDSRLFAYLNDFSKGMLFGARGNSGVILSQIFKGICEGLQGLESMGTSDFLQALILGYKTAYSAVINPVEGTVLTVAREGTEYVSELFDPDTSFETILEYYLQGMKRSLKETPKLLPVLMQAGVEDSGALGFILIVEGMYRYLCGEVISASNPEDKSMLNVNLEVFGPDSNFDFGYCMEFLLRLMSSKTDLNSFDFEAFSKRLRAMGESAVCVRDDSIIKVHIHVFKPSAVIDFAQQYGEFLTFKLENMCLQHNENIQLGSEKKKHLPLAVIAVGNGSGIKASLSAFECVTYLDGGSTMNTSAEEFVTALEKIDADRVVIMPNNKNVVKAARQALELCKAENVEIIETSDVIQCFYALSMDMPEEDSDLRIKAMKECCSELKTVSIFKSVRTCTIDGIACKEGQYVCMVGASIVSSDSDFIQALKKGLNYIENIDDCEMCFAFMGVDFIFQNEVSALFSADYSDINLQLIAGGQKHRELIMGIV